MLYLIRITVEDCVIEADSVASAIQEFSDNVRFNYMYESDETWWFEFALNDLQPFDEDSHNDDCKYEHEGKTYGFDKFDWLSDYVEVDPIAPDCTEGEHDWQDENSYAYQGSSGIGVSYWQTCQKCGCGKFYDSGAQRPQDGSQGHTLIRYERKRAKRLASENY